MKRALLSPFYAPVLVLLLTIANLSLANAAPGKHITSSKKISKQLTLTAPVDVVVSTDPWSDVATGVSLGDPIIGSDDGTTYSVINNAPDNYPIGITNVLWTVTDSKGNTATATQTVTVKDTQKPVIFRMGEISVVNDPGKCGAAVNLMIPGTYDNSGGPVTITSDAPSFFPVGSVMITWTATDMYGNSDTSTQTITVIDNEVPTISVTNISVNNDAGKCGANVNLGTPLTADNCGVASVTNDAPAFFPTGTTLVHWTVTDNHGYTNSATQTVVVADIEKPVIAAPVSLTVNNTAGQCGASVTLTAPATSDNCGVSSVTNNAPASFPAGTTIVTWIVTENSGNTATATQSVTVKDVQAPVFSGVPVNTTVSCSGIPAAITPVVTDNCTAQPTVSLVETSTRGTDPTKTAYYNYTITRTWTAKDASNNSKTAQQVITVVDNMAPVITVPANISVGNDVNVCGAVVKFTVTATDNCSSPVTLTFSKNSNTLFSSGTTTVTVTAKDVSGNASSKSFTVTVTDTEKPSVTAPANLNYTVNSSNNTVSNVNLGTPITSDNCGVKTTTNNAPSSYAVGTTTVVWTVKDAAGNASTATQTVTVTVAKKKTNATTNALGVTKENNTNEEDLQVVVAPNPSTTYFTLVLKSKNDMPIALRVFDEAGRIVDAKSRLGANSTVQVGQNYIPGLYVAEIIQGAQRRTVKLMKVR